MAIRTKYENLKYSFTDEKFQILFGKVYYDDKQIPQLTQSSVPFRKSTFYTFENELRAVILNQHKTFLGEPNFEKGVGIGVDLNKLIETVYVSPMSDDRFFDLVKHIVVERFQINCPVVPSEIKENS